MNAGPTRVLELLRDANGPCSGERLSQALGVSRAQVWKHVESLRKRGYEVDGTPGGGYRLAGSPDRLYPEEIQSGLGTRWLARELHHFDSTDSTNRVALELARAGAPHGATVVAEHQDAGRGRLGRSFFSPAHVNLYSSTVLRPELTTDRAPTLILAAAVAVAETVAATVTDGSRVEIKWPNDVQIAGRKTSGILVELAAEATRVSHAVLGIGVNLNVDPKTFPDEFRGRATSLCAHTDGPVDRAAFARALYTHLEDALDRHAAGGFAALRGEFEARFCMTGRDVTVVETGGAEQSGRVKGIAEDGALLLESEAGSVVRVVAGDVTLKKGETP
ncbi:MAG: biotin--[acetyl-CoA-carboxylase] ligase [Proteobacteria bacterium]|nr:biotin--[acetyl-CoA-carboxylase] ligase [Pseudomonadota bacterium]